MGTCRCSWIIGTMGLLEMSVVMVCTSVTLAAKLPTPSNIYMKSSNMKHCLYWDPILNAEGTVKYSVQVQGEYERHYKSQHWTNVDSCQSITAHWCNVTEEIASTVQYELRVRAELGSQNSDWAKLETPFNRNTSVLTPPAIKFHSTGPLLTLETEYFGPQFIFFVFYWKKGHKDKVVSKKMYRGATIFHLEKAEGGHEYCAQVIAYAVPIKRNSSRSDVVCAAAKGSELSTLTVGFISLFGVIVGLVILLALLRNVALIMRYSCFPHGKIPKTLMEPFSSQKMTRPHFLEDCEKITSSEPSNKIPYTIIRQDCSTKIQIL
ncbi:hypothetical protein XENTR_v10014883 [Xenopus tropicalis]|uniref:Interleukin 20 receptor subunit beta n=1 Tax=Xenopus tropicalis TaxID=8364 RepID=A0A6I8S5J1_XENTR|nr:interleukin-20 receptor subunit beta isoform X2 [Xenopus tropicalis]KAE8604895.1 hypothetical protein XENTR_v10014883 [Xenopus tropicalis]|eukprot:XP_004917829.1 PREDICTED: interleukin-20 receptor subunit beta isoform X2 [Xenopus tropicalis]